MSALNSQAAFWQSFWALFDAAIAYGVDPQVMTPGSESDGRGRPSAAAIMAFAADFYGIDMVQLCGQRRDRHLVEARALAAWGLRNAGLQWTYTAIGRAMAGRDHTTIINLVRRAEQYRKQSARFAGACEDMRRAFHIVQEQALCQRPH